MKLRIGSDYLTLPYLVSIEWDDNGQTNIEQLLYEDRTRIDKY